jgi:hypothetical protein
LTLSTHHCTLVDNMLSVFVGRSSPMDFIMNLEWQAIAKNVYSAVWKQYNLVIRTGENRYMLQVWNGLDVVYQEYKSTLQLARSQAQEWVKKQQGEKPLPVPQQKRLQSNTLQYASSIEERMKKVLGTLESEKPETLDEDFEHLQYALNELNAAIAKLMAKRQ